MSLGKVAQALQIVNQALSNKKVTTTTPISLNTYTVLPLRGKDEVELKTQINPNKPESKINEILYQTLYKHIELPSNTNDNAPDTDNVDSASTFISFEEFVKSNSNIDATELFHAFNQASFEYIPKHEYICPHCETKNVIEKLPYKEFKNKGSKWDKDVKFTEYRYDIAVNITDNLSITAKTMIPTLYYELAIIKKVLSERPGDINSMFTTRTNVEKLLFVVDKLTINNNDNTIELDNAFDIKTVLEELPEVVLEDILNKYEEEFGKYTPMYVYVHKCKECEKENEIVYHPIVEFITRIIV